MNQGVIIDTESRFFLPNSTAPFPLGIELIRGDPCAGLRVFGRCEVARDKLPEIKGHVWERVGGMVGRSRGEIHTFLLQFAYMPVTYHI